MPNKAFLVKTLELPQSPFFSNVHAQAIYRLDPPLEGYDHVLVSAATVLGTGPETYIFGADSDGNVTSWGELPGSYRGGLSHLTALEGAGYDLMQKGQCLTGYGALEDPLRWERILEEPNPS